MKQALKQGVSNVTHCKLGLSVEFSFVGPVTCNFEILDPKAGNKPRAPVLGSGVLTTRPSEEGDSAELCRLLLPRALARVTTSSCLRGGPRECSFKLLRGAQSAAKFETTAANQLDLNYPNGLLNPAPGSDPVGLGQLENLHF